MIKGGYGGNRADITDSNNDDNDNDNDNDEDGESCNVDGGDGVMSSRERGTLTT